MTPRPSPEQALRAWRSEPIPVEDPDASASRRREVVSRMAGIIRLAAERRQRTARRTRYLGIFAAAAVVLLGLGGVWRARAAEPIAARAQLAAAWADRSVPMDALAPQAAPRLEVIAGEVVVRSGGSELAATSGQQLGPEDDVWIGADARAQVTLPSGSVVDAGSATRLSVRQGMEGALVAERVHLGRGRVEVQVPKLGPQRALLVLAPDAEVVVHGTVFEVVVREIEGGGTETSVSVSEGVVAVRHRGGESPVHAGHRWSSSIPAEVAAAEATRAAPSPRPGAAPTTARASTERDGSGPSTERDGNHPSTERDGSHPSTKPAPTVATTDPSKLAEQNRLFQSAMAHKQRGDDRAAVAALDELLTRHPGAPLTQEARVERMRALQRLGDRAAAAREARRYLAEHRDGFAREEAKDLAVTPSASPPAPTSAAPRR